MNYINTNTWVCPKCLAGYFSYITTCGMCGTKNTSQYETHTLTNNLTANQYYKKDDAELHWCKKCERHAPKQHFCYRPVTL